MTRWSRIAWALLGAAMAVVVLTLSPGARAGQGRGTLYGGVTSLGGSPAAYRLSVNSTSGVTVGDHLMAAISGGGTGVWEVSAITSTTITVEDSLTEEHGAFGAPVGGGSSGVFAYSTPTAAGLTLIPDGALYWSAALRRNAALASVNVGTSLSITSGAADPESSVTAPAGSLYLRTNGTAYLKASGSGSTGWKAISAP